MKSAKVEGHTIYEPKLSIGSSRQLIAPVPFLGMTLGRSGLAESCNSRTFLKSHNQKTSNLGSWQNRESRTPAMTRLGRVLGVWQGSLLEKMSLRRPVFI